MHSREREENLQELHLSKDKNKLAILITDDSSFHRNTIRKQLDKVFKNYEIVEAVNGEDAVNKCKEKAFDVIFMDNKMPGMYGDEAAKKIREDQAQLNTELTCCILTCSADEDNAQKFQGKFADANAAVNKPIIVPELRSLMSKILPSRFLNEEPLPNPVAEEAFPDFSMLDEKLDDTKKKNQTSCCGQKFGFFTSKEVIVATAVTVTSLIYFYG